MLCCCEKCIKSGGFVFLILGIFFLLRDMGVWDFWNVQWWTALFLIAGATYLMHGSCPDCMKSGKKKK